MRTILKKIFDGVENAKPLKNYVFYALGEMVLIVLSLLLALQLNELNQKSKNSKLRQSYYKSLIEDYQSDLKQIMIVKNAFQKELKQIDKFGQRLNSPLATQDTLIEIVRREFNPNIPPFVSYTATTFETLKETGNVELLGNDVLQLINVLQKLHEEQKAYQHISLESHARLLENYLNNYPLKKGVINSGSLHEKLWSKIETKNLLLEFNGLLTITRSTLMNAMFYYEKIYNKTENIREILKAKIE